MGKHGHHHAEMTENDKHRRIGGRFLQAFGGGAVVFHKSVACPAQPVGTVDQPVADIAVYGEQPVETVVNPVRLVFQVAVLHEKGLSPALPVKQQGVVVEVSGR